MSAVRQKKERCIPARREIKREQFMHHFFVKNDQIRNDKIYIIGEDYNHAANVLRLRTGEEVLISDEDGQDYLCEVEYAADAAGKENRRGKEAGEPAETMPVLSVLETVDPVFSGLPHLRLSVRERQAENHELPARVWLFQGLPKSDKMEWIIQKATELGVSDIVPVDMKNCVVRLDEKKAAAKEKRWQAIAESAAKQSKRSRIPVVHPVMKFTDAMRISEQFDVRILPYEAENGIVSMCEAIVSFLPGRDIAVMIGPEGGFDRMEAKLAESRGWVSVSLGKRILRTETAAIAALSMIMIRLEIVSQMELETD